FFLSECYSVYRDRYVFPTRRSSDLGVAQHYMKCDTDFIRQVKADPSSTSLSEKLKMLLSIAGSVQKGGKHVTDKQIQDARKAGADRKSTRLNSSHQIISYAVFCLKK